MSVCNFLYFVLIWTLISFPVALVVGSAIHEHTNTDDRREF